MRWLTRVVLVISLFMMGIFIFVVSGLVGYKVRQFFKPYVVLPPQSEQSAQLCPTKCPLQKVCMGKPYCKNLQPCDCVVPPGRVKCPTEPSTLPIMADNKRPAFDIISDENFQASSSWKVIMDIMENHYKPYYEKQTSRESDGDDPPMYFPGDEQQLCPITRKPYDFLKCITNNIEFMAFGERQYQHQA